MPADRARISLCLITDRRRLTAAMGQPMAVAEQLLLDQVTGAIRGGVDVVQVRERDLDAGALAALVRRCHAAAAGTRTRIVVNDRVDVALATGIDGVHFREDSLTVAAARQLLPPTALVGRSVHAPSGAIDAGPVDYLLAGSVFPTTSKREDTVWLGIDGLRAIVLQAGARPVWAVGGVTLDRIAVLLAAGVAGVAAISAFILPGPPDEIAMRVQKQTQDLRFCFDTPEQLS